MPRRTYRDRSASAVSGGPTVSLYSTDVCLTNKYEIVCSKSDTSVATSCDYCSTDNDNQDCNYNDDDDDDDDGTFLGSWQCWRESTSKDTNPDDGCDHGCDHSCDCGNFCCDESCDDHDSCDKDCKESCDLNCGTALCKDSSQGTMHNGYTRLYLCSAGEYRDGSWRYCHNCAAGKHSSKEQVVSGPTSCTNCAAGTYSGARASACTTCDAGKYSVGVTGTSQGGDALLEKGQGDCAPCASGKYSPSTGRSSCLDCANGTWSARSDLGTISCTPCVGCAAGTTRGG